MNRDLRAISAVGMLVAGVGLSVAGFCVPSVGEISDSVLWFFAQCLLYAGAAHGIDVFVEKKIHDFHDLTENPPCNTVPDTVLP